MPTNAEAAQLFRGIANVLDVLGERFKPEAYRRAARSIESLTEDLATIEARGELGTIPGVGAAIEEKIREYLRTGRLEYRERLSREVPPGILALVEVPGLGPKTARRFWLELGVEGPAELSDAIAAGRLDGLQGFGPKKVDQIRKALAGSPGARPASRRPIEVAYPTARRLLDGLRAVGGVQEAEIAGSFRRGRESVGDLDLLVTSTDPERVFDAFSHVPEVREVRLRGPTKETVLLTDGLQVDLRVVEPAAFGAALQYFTGSKDHNVQLRSLARERGLKINEYGVFRGDERVGGRTEAEVYAALELAWIPPELREGRDEIDLATKGPLPHLVERSQLTGELHAHLPADAGVAEVDGLLAAARTLGLSYLGCVVAGVAPDGAEFSLPEPALDRLQHAGSPELAVGRAVEVDPEATTDRWDELRPDYAIVRPSARRAEPTPSPDRELRATLVAHVGGEVAGRSWIAWARSQKAAVEVGPGPDRLDSTLARAAREAGVPLVVPTGVGRPSDDPTSPVAVGFARRAGAGPNAVRNAATRAEVTRGWRSRRAD
ncbi:MAG: helix-hairpin-helix domain-containing protein [Thermoplasmata archaeon]